MNKMTQDMRKDTILMMVWRSSGFISTMLRSLLLLVLMTVGMQNMWGQETPNYSGTYYIRSESDQKNTAGDYYMCPTKSWYLYKATNSYENGTDNDDIGQPFLTTYQCKVGNYDVSKAAWTLVKHQTKANCYYIIQKKTGRYMVSNGQIGTSAYRMRVHLESVADATALSALGDLALFEITTHDDHFDIVPHSDAGRVSNTYKYLVVNYKNFNELKGSAGKEGGPNNSNTAGIIGIYDTENNHKWQLEIPKPTFELIKENDIEKIKVTEAFDDVTIYYTTDGTDPVLPAAGEEPTEPTVKYTSAIPLNENNQVMIKLIATNDNHTISTPIVTYVYTCDITWSNTRFEYNGTAQTPKDISVKIGGYVLPFEYTVSCSNNTNAGTAKLTIKEKTVGNNIVSGSKNFTIEKAPLKIMVDAKEKGYLDEDPELTFSVEGLKYRDKKNYAVTKCQLSRTSGEALGTYTIDKTSNPTINSNYNLISFTSSTLTINQKNIGDGGTPAKGVTVYAKKDGESSWSVSLYNGKNAFTEDDYEYSVSNEPDADGNYIVTVTAKGTQCTGSAQVTYSNITFPIQIGTEERAIPYFIADKDLKTSTVIPYIISRVNPSVGTISIIPISYIPKDVPVLLLAPADATGLTISPMNGEETMSENTLNINKLMYSSEGAITVAAAQVYLYYVNNNIGEFVLTTAGSIKQNSFYLYNPNYYGGTEVPNSDPNEAPARTLDIIKDEMTGLLELTDNHKRENTNDWWYSLDGRRLSGKPVKKGLYIQKGQKVIIKKK